MIFVVNVNFFNVQIKSSKSENEIISLKNQFKAHQTEAEMFYKIQKEIKSSAINDNTVCAISIDFEKNLPLPITKVSYEYYLRQLWIHNFCIHDMKSGKADMFPSFENFAAKGPNETISCLDFYIRNRISGIKKLFIFSDNCFAQNKNRYIWIYYLSLIMNNYLEEITIIYPIPGHSYLDCDRDFGRIDKTDKIEKVGTPSQWVSLIKKTDKNFTINYVNFPLTDDLESDETPVISVKDYEMFFETALVNNVEKLSQIRKIQFNKKRIFTTTDLQSEKFGLTLNLILF
jgi:hypothetical protein